MRNKSTLHKGTSAATSKFESETSRLRVDGLLPLSMHGSSLIFDKISKRMYGYANGPVIFFELIKISWKPQIIGLFNVQEHPFFFGGGLRRWAAAV